MPALPFENVPSAGRKFTGKSLILNKALEQRGAGAAT
jgi:hypothetical protein